MPGFPAFEDSDGGLNVFYEHSFNGIFGKHGQHHVFVSFVSHKLPIRGHFPNFLSFDLVVGIIWPVDPEVRLACPVIGGRILPISLPTILLEVDSLNLPNRLIDTGIESEPFGVNK